MRVNRNSTSRYGKRHKTPVSALKAKSKIATRPNRMLSRCSRPLPRGDKLEGKSMTKVTSNEKRQAWSTPELRRIRAGSAEALNNAGAKNDGGSPGPNKS